MNQKKYLVMKYLSLSESDRQFVEAEIEPSILDELKSLLSSLPYSDKLNDKFIRKFIKREILSQYHGVELGSPEFRQWRLLLKEINADESDAPKALSQFLENELKLAR